MPRNRTVMEAEILRVAAEVFSKKGYRTATLEDLASAVGISRATFYTYFPSKEELLCRLYRQHFSVTQAEVKRIIEQDLPVQEKLRRIIRFQIVYVATHQPLVQVFFSEMLNLPPKMSRIVTQAGAEYHTAVEQVIADGVRQGVFKQIDPRLTTYGLMGMSTWLYHWYRPEGQQSPESIADSFIQLLEAGYMEQASERDGNPLLHAVRELRQEVGQLRTAILPRSARRQVNALSPEVES